MPGQINPKITAGHACDSDNFTAWQPQKSYYHVRYWTTLKSADFRSERTHREVGGSSPSAPTWFKVTSMPPEGDFKVSGVRVLTKYPVGSAPTPPPNLSLSLREGRCAAPKSIVLILGEAVFMSLAKHPLRA